MSTIPRCAALSGAALSATISLAGCATPSLYSLDSNESVGARPDPIEAAQAPKVLNLIDHARCELINAYLRNTYAGDTGLTKNTKELLDGFYAKDGVRPSPAASALWKRLYQYNFQSSLDFTLLLTQTEAVSPSLTLTRPSDYMGGKLKTIAVSATGMQPSANYSQALTLSGQVSSTQDHYFDVTYQIGFHDLIDQVRLPNGDGAHYVLATRLITECNKPARGAKTGLQGSLRLEETLGGGLSAIDEASRVIDDPEVRQIAFDREQAQLAAEKALITKVQKGLPLPPPPPAQASATAPGINSFALITPLKIPVGGTGHAGVGKALPAGVFPAKAGAALTSGPSGPSPNQTNFTSRVDFILLWGGGTNPSLSTIWVKLGGGSGAGGAGSGGAGGGGGGSGGGGGGSGGGGNLLNYSNSRTDTLVATFSPNCLEPPALEVKTATGQITGDHVDNLDLTLTQTERDPEAIIVADEATHIKADQPPSIGLNIDSFAIPAAGKRGEARGAVTSGGDTRTVRFEVNVKDDRVQMLGTMVDPDADPKADAPKLYLELSTVSRPDSPARGLIFWGASLSGEAYAALVSRPNGRVFWTSLPYCTNTVATERANALGTNAELKNLQLNFTDRPVR